MSLNLDFNWDKDNSSNSVFSNTFNGSNFTSSFSYNGAISGGYKPGGTQFGSDSINKLTENFSKDLEKYKKPSLYPDGKNPYKWSPSIEVPKIGETVGTDTKSTTDNVVDNNQKDNNPEDKNTELTGDVSGDKFGWKDFANLTLKGAGYAMQSLPHFDIGFGKAIDSGQNKAKDSLNTSLGMSAINSGNPWVAAAGLTILAGNKLGANADASTNGTFLENAGNLLLGAAVPGSKAFAHKVGEIETNKRVAASSAYRGTATDVNKMLADSGGLFIFGSNKIADKIGKAALDQEKAAANLEATDKALAASSTQMIANRVKGQMAGGFNIVSSKKGSVLKDVRKCISSKKTLKKYKKLQEGGLLVRNIDELAKYANDVLRETGGPEFLRRTLYHPIVATWDLVNENGEVETWADTHEFEWMPYGENKALVFSKIQNIDGNLVRFEDVNEAFKNALSNNDVLEMSPTEAIEFVDKYRTTSDFFDIKYDEDFNNFMKSLPDNQKYTPRNEYATDLLWKYGGKPKDFEQAVKNGLYTYDENTGLWKGNSVVLNPSDGIQYLLKPKQHKTLWVEEAFYDGYKPILKEGFEDNGDKENYTLIPLEGQELLESQYLRDNYTFDKSGDYYKFIPKEESDILIEEFKKGGAFNVIPEGALHKNKHHLEDIDEKFKKVTHKGIPVITEDADGKITQHAEVEKEEIIFRYEVTKKLEELSKKEGDEAAIEAGKLLVYEILHNTIDNTKNLI